MLAIENYLLAYWEDEGAEDNSYSELVAIGDRYREEHPYTVFILFN